MAGTDYLLFIHGVNTRSLGVEPNYADGLFELIKRNVGPSERAFEKIPIYWGDLNDQQEEWLREVYHASPLWKHFWFRDLRERQLLRFVGDAALYLSRYVGSNVADVVKNKMLEYLSHCTPEDRLHLITHSLGTIILFDMLFSTRWDDSSVPGADSVNAFRDMIFGVAPNPLQGIRIGSITTMGSPIAIFSLMDVDRRMQEAKTAHDQDACTHDITPRLQQLLASLHPDMAGLLPWRNFAHPGDPIAYPLATLLPSLIDEEHRYLDIEDRLVHPTIWTGYLFRLFRSSFLAVINGGAAHSSYWHSKEVARGIGQIIRQAITDEEITEAVKHKNRKHR